MQRGYRPFDSRVHSLRAFDSAVAGPAMSEVPLVRAWPAMSEAVLGRVEWSYGDSNPEFNHAMVA